MSRFQRSNPKYQEYSSSDESSGSEEESGGEMNEHEVWFTDFTNVIEKLLIKNFDIDEDASKFANDLMKWIDKYPMPEMD